MRLKYNIIFFIFLTKMFRFALNILTLAIGCHFDDIPCTCKCMNT